MTTLPQQISERIDALSEEGNGHLEDGDFESAIQCFTCALELLPEPIFDWEASAWLLAAIGDAFFYSEDYQSGFGAFSDALRPTGGIGNPFIHLRLGQCALELGDRSRAKKELTRAFLEEGEEIFSDEDPKYLEFVKDR